MRCNNDNYIERLKKGKEDALEFIMDKYLPLVNGTVYKVLCNSKRDGIIDECINDVFLSIWNNRKSFSGNETDFKKWIYKIAKFKAIDYYRKEMKNKEISFEVIESGNSKSSEDEFLISEDKKEIIKLLNTLEEVDKKIFTMKFLLGIKSEEIAKSLGMTRTAVDTRVFRARKKLDKHNRNQEMEVV